MRIKSSLKKDNPADKKEAAEPTPLHFDFEVDPKTDPNSPKFDAMAIKAAIDAKQAEQGDKFIAARKMQEIIDKIASMLSDDVATGGHILNLINDVIEQIDATLDAYNATLLEFMQDELDKPQYKGKTLEEIEAEGKDENGKIIPGSLYEQLQQDATDAMNLELMLSEEEELQPYLQAELSKPQYEGKSIDELREAYLNDIEAGQLYEQAIDAAQKAADDDTERPADNQQSKRPKTQIVALDKLSTVVFADWLNMEKELHGQVQMFPVKMEANNTKDDTGELTLFFDVSYPEELADKEKKLTPFDRRLYSSMYNLQRANGSDMTFTQIFKNAGLGEKPTASQIERAKQSIDKMRRTTTKWDNREEAAAYGKTGYYAEYDGYLCPVELITERKLFNGKPVEMFVRTLRPLPLMAFAEERKQIALVPNFVIALPPKVNATDLNIALIDYVAKRIVRSRNEDGKKPEKKRRNSVKIIYDTLYKNIGATTRQKQRTAKANLFLYLDELKKRDYIESYKEEVTKSTGGIGVMIKYSLPNN